MRRLRSAAAGVLPRLVVVVTALFLLVLELLVGLVLVEYDAPFR